MSKDFQQIVWDAAVEEDCRQIVRLAVREDLDRLFDWTTLALVPLGYADGVPRAASDRAQVMIGGQRHPVVGRIAMDQFLVDVGDAAVEVGDEVILWGDGATGAPTAEEWATWADTINYEIVTRVGARVPRVTA